MKYFRKVDPRIKVVISTGEGVKFEAVSWDVGVYPPEGIGISEFLKNELLTAMAQGRGGMTEITFEEYTALLDKKKTEPDGLLRPSREEFKLNLSLEKMAEAARTAEAARSQSTPTIAPPVQAAAEVNMHDQARMPSAPGPLVPGTAVQPAAPALARPVASKGKKPK